MKEQQLIDFEEKVLTIYEAGKIKAPVHFSRGNEKQLIGIFKYVSKDDIVFSTWRSHYHALLHGVDEEQLLKDIVDGKSITIHSPQNKFFTSAIVNGILPIAVGSAMALKRKQSTNKVWCFVGDMSAESGIFYEALKYSIRNRLPITFVVEDNGLSTKTPTQESWGDAEHHPDSYYTIIGLVECLSTHLNLHCNVDFLNDGVTKIGEYVMYYKYTRVLPHQGCGKWINF